MSASPYRLLMTADAVGGVWSYALDAALYLKARGVQVVLAVLGPPLSPAQRQEAHGLDIVETGEALDWLSDNPEPVRAAAERVARLAHECEADLVHLNGTPLAGEAEFGVPVVAVHHSCTTTWWRSVKGGSLPADWRWRRDLTRMHLFCADAVAAPTRAFAIQTAETFGLREVPRVIFNGRKPPAELGGSPINVVFTAGRLWDEAKNIATLDEAAQWIKASVFAAGELRSPQGARASFPRIETLGILDAGEMQARLLRKPIYVAAPLYEPFGLSILEAAQAGSALVLSDIPSLRELWDGAARFVAPRDADGLALAVNWFLADPEMRAEFSAAAQERAQHYTRDRFGGALLDWHHETLARAAGRGS